MTSRRSREPRGDQPVEWTGGSVELSANVAGELRRPEVLMWMGPDGVILGSTVVEPGEALSMASESLQSAIEQPIQSRPHRPTRVRVASAALADALRAGHRWLDVVCAPTPELDGVLADMRDRMAERDMTEDTYLSPGVSPEAMGAFFKAAAELFRAKPWQVVPNDESPLSVTIESLGVHDAVVSVAGEREQSFRIVLLSGLDDVESYLDALDAVDLGEGPDLPPHLFFVFDSRAEVAPEEREEISEHQWEVAGDNAYPRLLAAGDNGVDRPLTDKEVTIAEAIASALPHVTTDEQALWDAGDGLQPLSRTISVLTHAGEVEVILATPYSKRQPQFDPSHDILAELARDVYEIDHDARHELEDELVGRFITSPEGKEVDESFACRFVMELAANHVGQTIATLDADGLGEVLFEVIPRKVSIEASEAFKIVKQLRAFYKFLKRELELEHADACLKMLGGDAVDKLQAALSDGDNFGPAKSMVMAGADAGYDMGTEEGIESWMRLMQDEPQSQAMPSPSHPKPLSKKAAQAKKNKRKAARKARKKNR